MKVLGDALRKERELRDMTLAEISKEVHVSVRFLAAIENEDFDQISGSFYVKQYIRSYLKAMGADETAFFNQYKPQLDAILHKKEHAQEQVYENIKYSKFKNHRLILWLAVVLLVALVAVLTVMAGIPGWVSARFAPASPPQMAPLPATLPGLMPTAIGFPPCHDQAPVRIRLEFSARAWAQVTRNGVKLLEGTFDSGRQVELSGYRMTVVIGNPAATRLWANDREVTSFRGAAESQRLVIEPATLAPIPGP